MDISDRRIYVQVDLLIHNINMDAIRKIQFLFRGYRNFTKSEKPLPPLEGSLENLNYVITGANSGIGFEAAKFAA